MQSINNCLKEWNAVIEALGQGKQTFLIRFYKTNHDKFLLYPTFTYALKNDFLEGFQDNYADFVEKNAFPEKESDKTLIKYYAKVEKIIDKPSRTIGGLQKYYIWTPDHVKSYLRGRTANIWLLRVYKLKKPYLAERTFGAIKYANLKESIPLDGKPVLSNSEFDEIVEKLK